MELGKLKTAKVLSRTAVNVIEDADNTAAKIIMAMEDTRKDLGGELTMGLIGAAINVGLTMLPSDFMAQAVDGALDITDFAEAADISGDLLIAGAAISAANKFSSNFKALSSIDSMTDAQFDELLASRDNAVQIPQKSKRGSKKQNLLDGAVAAEAEIL